MLPIIDVNQDDFCKMRFNYCLGLILPIVQSYWFNRQEFIEHAIRLHYNLDEYLTGRLAAFLVARQPRSRALIYYGAIRDRSALAVCSFQKLSFKRALGPGIGRPGYLEIRRDFLLQTATPFLLYDLGSMYRLYQMTDPAQDAFYVCDLGNLLGNLLFQTDKQFYFRLLNQKERYFTYSAVPRTPTTELIFGHHRFNLHHAFCRPI